MSCLNGVSKGFIDRLTSFSTALTIFLVHVSFTSTDNFFFFLSFLLLVCIHNLENRYEIFDVNFYENMIHNLIPRTFVLDHLSR